MQTRAHRLEPQNVEPLLQESGALTIRDAVEERLSLVRSHDFTADRVRRAEAILGDTPELVLEEGDPARLVIVLQLGAALHGQEGHEGGERLVEPQVVPPLHCDQIAKPHVGQLMQVCD